MVHNHVLEGLSKLISNHMQHIDYLSQHLNVYIGLTVSHLLVIPLVVCQLALDLVLINSHLVLVLPEGLYEVDPRAADAFILTVPVSISCLRNN